MLHFRLLVYFLISCSTFLVSCDTQNSNSFKTAQQILGDSNYLAICYGGYRQNTREVQPSIPQIKEDLKLMSAIGIKVLRTYNTKQDEIRNLLEAISELKSDDANFEMYVMLGVWIECENAFTSKTLNHERENLEANIEEIERAVLLSNKYPEIIKIISVGNEAMVKWATSYYVSPSIILKWVNYLQNLKKEKILAENLWITSSDNFASWGGGDSTYHVEALKKLYATVDYISIHTYPMHDTHYNSAFWTNIKFDKGQSKEMMLNTQMLSALNYAKAQYQSVKDYMHSIGVNKPIHIGETGWSTKSDGFYGREGSKACDEYKSAMYYDLIRNWTNKENITCFYFEAFDENWKDAENPEGSENHFGLFTIDGKAKYALWKHVDAGIFRNLRRDDNNIVKTYDGNLDKLLLDVEMP